MSTERQYRTFSYREANYRICCEKFDIVTAEIVRLRHALEDYIRRHPPFGYALAPVPALPDAPDIAVHMALAAERAGVGPMAAVAGAIAQRAAEAALNAGASEAIVDNGGDIYLVATGPVVIALYTGTPQIRDRLALRIEPSDTPLAVCSSSSTMGRSLSLGACDLATVVAADAALADAAATQAANMVRSADDIEHALEHIAGIPGISGLLLVKGDRIGLKGRLPQLVKNQPATPAGPRDSPSASSPSASQAARHQARWKQSSQQPSQPQKCQ